MAETSPIVAALILGAAVATLWAWWISIRHGRQTRALIAHLETRHPAIWHTLSARYFNPVGAIEAYRVRHGAADPAFRALYDEKRRRQRALFRALMAGFALIGVLMIGTQFWGWRF